MENSVIDKYFTKWLHMNNQEKYHFYDQFIFINNDPGRRFAL